MINREIIDSINKWRIEDGKGAVINEWYKAGQKGRFPIWAWENRKGKFWEKEIEDKCLFLQK